MDGDANQPEPDDECEYCEYLAQYGEACGCPLNAAIREATRVGNKVAIKITMIEAPKITTQPRLLVELSDDENVLQQYEE